MLTRIYECSDIVMDFIFSMLLARYVFLIPPLKSHKAEIVFPFVACSFACLFASVFGLASGHFTMGLCIGIYIFLACEGMTIRYVRAFWFIPIMGLALALVIPMTSIPPKLFQMNTIEKEIYQLVWNERPFGTDNTVAVHIRHLREKVEINPAEPRYIKVLFGRGYVMEQGGRR